VITALSGTSQKPVTVMLAYVPDPMSPPAHVSAWADVPFADATAVLDKASANALAETAKICTALRIVVFLPAQEMILGPDAN
jgi:hypothetical protein